MSIILPKEKLPPTKNAPNFLFLYGQRKIGKTTCLAGLENCLLIETDSYGADYVSALKIQVNNLKEYVEVCEEIIKSGKPYKYIALDTTTKLEEWCEDHATEEYKKSVQGKNFTGRSVLEITAKGKDGESFSTGYLWLRLSFQTFMAKLIPTAPHVIGIGHVTDKQTGTDKDNNLVSAKEIDHTGKIKRMICAGADAIGYVYRQAKQPAKSGDPIVEVLRVSFKVNSKEFVNCGTRIDRLAGEDIELGGPKVFDWSKIYPKE